MTTTDWLDGPVALAPQVTLIDGADGHSLLFDPETGTYVRLSRTGARLVPLLDGSRTGTALLDAARRSRGPDGVRDRAPVLLSFLTDLRAAGVLSVPPEPLRGRDRAFARLFRLTPRIRIPARHLNRMLRPPSMLLARFPRTFTALTLLAAVASVVVIALALSRPGPAVYVGPPWVLTVGVLLVQAAAHEMGHAAVCQALGVPVREAGVKLFCLLIPLTYVDRTDAYRVRSRFGRSAVALVGPMIDLVATGVVALLVLLDPARFDGLLWLLGMQMFVIFNNLNPLLPFTDGHHAMEAALGEINLRDRAFRYLGHVLLRRPMPAAHRAVSTARRGLYLVYGLVSAVFVGLLLTMISMNYYRLVVQFLS
ncbi:PqqD family peptide modification chaperone [Actinoplanes sp. HUAS TT8]|uniref:PqqD family peptide modification chaperone n=1 Tax=Actinoplanes sp. HUAS TT8 TaxID=3447453 RepID=UPI003F52569F